MSPTQYVGELWRIVDLLRFADKGTLPVIGGVLDQTSAFLRLLDAWRASCAIHLSNE